MLATRGTELGMQIKILEEQIKQRETLIEEVVKLAVKLINTHGSEISKHQASSHTNIIRELKLDGYTLTLDECLTMMGGSTLRIDNAGKRPVFYLFIQDSDFPEDWNPSDEGLNEVRLDELPMVYILLDTLKCGEETIQKSKEKERSEVEVREEESKLASRLEGLRKRAAFLKIETSG